MMTAVMMVMMRGDVYIFVYISAKQNKFCSLKKKKLTCLFFYREIAQMKHASAAVGMSGVADEDEDFQVVPVEKTSQFRIIFKTLYFKTLFLSLESNNTQYFIFFVQLYQRLCKSPLYLSERVKHWNISNTFFFF